ncbi:DUF2971 domain-containing protein [Klebsiella aerogenes]|uniref:DUF2971 domain-containing protein n=1 Tax=Enterobacteriaceae TaxID=543 RepID=UPI00136C545A|nr:MULTISPECIES: DUF2971 domain-containing protein [Enterobacteriaceae]HEM6629906.1 DUF2971 domain-containing protein [Citrobacter farmeri]MXE86546.1 DUF2971 domain-containing protein [Escherichia coli]NPD63942.1 DUF2971 domain-containing protein [Klebsiella aerogenes]NPE05447.1 DUF2971 domain-containing protein [Klebsiella aerogenes]HEM6632146.1 DUF2971 domain-containing protein [Citrobacter farmeri]
MQKGNSDSKNIMRVYYLTSAEYAISNIALNRLKISRYQDLNDPFELIAADSSAREIRKELRGIKKEIEQRQGIICFSDSWSNPLLWGHYADKHRGIALGFDIPESMLHKVKYKKGLSTITIDKCKDKAFIERLSLTKFKDWEYESERRLHIDLRSLSDENGLYFKSFSEDIKLKEVILGVKCSIPISLVRHLFKERNEVVNVIQSRIAYKNFKVVTNHTITDNQ